MEHPLALRSPEGNSCQGHLWVRPGPPVWWRSSILTGSHTAFYIGSLHLVQEEPRPTACGLVLRAVFLIPVFPGSWPKLAIITSLTHLGFPGAPARPSDPRVPQGLFPCSLCGEKFKVMVFIWKTFSWFEHFSGNVPICVVVWYDEL